MPRYFYTTVDGKPYHDTSGIVLDDDFAARKLGVRLLADMIRGDFDHLLDGHNLTVQISRDGGIPVASVYAAMIITAPPAADTVARDPSDESDFLDI